MNSFQSRFTRPVVSSYNPKGSGLYARSHKGTGLYKRQRGSGLLGGGFMDSIWSFGKNVVDWGKKVYDIVVPIIKNVKDSGVIGQVKDFISEAFQQGQKIFGKVKEGDYMGAVSGIKDTIQNSSNNAKGIYNTATDIVGKYDSQIRDILQHGKRVLQNEKKMDLAQTAIESNKNNAMNQQGKELRQQQQIEAKLQATNPALELGIPETIQGNGKIRQLLRKKNRKMVRRLVGSGFKQL